MSPTLLGTEAASSCFPRVSGDEPVSLVPPAMALTFSPRERG